MQNYKAELIDLLCEKSFKYSDKPTFKLASGRLSNFYVNCRSTALHPRGMFLIGHLMFDLLKHKGVDAVGGMTFGADPIAVATSFVSGLKDNPMRAFSIRKEQKDHGIIRWVEGDIEPGTRVAVIDDSVTTGGSTIKAIQRAREEGFEVVCAAMLVDRQEGAIDNIREHVTDVTPLITRDALVSRWNILHRQA